MRRLQQVGVKRAQKPPVARKRGTNLSDKNMENFQSGNGGVYVEEKGELVLQARETVRLRRSLSIVMQKTIAYRTLLYINTPGKHGTTTRRMGGLTANLGAVGNSTLATQRISRH